MPDERTLKYYMECASCFDIKTASFYEPDIDNQLTAACFEPSEASKKLLSTLPLALKSAASGIDKAAYRTHTTL